MENKMKNKIQKIFRLALLCTAFLFINPLQAAPPSKKPFVFGLILVGPATDHGWSEAHYNGGKYVESKLAGSKMIFVDNVNPAAKPGVTVPQLVAELVSKGAELVITNSDDFQDGTLEAAKKHPKLPIINISGDHAWKEGKNYKAPPNLSNVMGRMEYGKMLQGCAAALTTKSGKIGYVGPLINDETRRLASASFLGARYCWTEFLKKKPEDLKFKATWIGFWFNVPGQTLDPTKVTADFYLKKFDVVLSGIDTTEVLVEATRRSKTGVKVYALPYDYEDACKKADDVCLGTPYYNWGPAYLKAAHLVRDGKWHQYWEWNYPDFKDLNNKDTSAIGFKKGGALGAKESQLVDTFLSRIGDKSVNLFKGPLFYQDGSVYLKEGEVATDQQIWYFQQLLQGMEGSSR
jgi:simple sugar transport system substrate-binding protein